MSVELFAWVAFLTPVLAGMVSAVIPSRYAWLVSITSPVFMLVSVIHSLLLLTNCWNETPALISYDWFTVGIHHFTIGMKLDNSATIMMVVVSTVSLLVQLYSSGYMAGDIAIRRYFAMLGLFTTSMMGIVLANNLLMIFVFWELVGFSSYMLIGHWFERVAAGSAARKAFLFNRIGDAGFIIGLMILFQQTGTFSLQALESQGNFTWQTAACFCILAGVAGKSAQFPLLTWLPDAMAGPTPVSALIHAATMVAAGVFLLARIFFLFTPPFLDVVAILGVVTSIIGATTALAQTDIKKVLAYSTISQLGLMVMAIGVGSKESALLHLFTHAFFKAGLFLAAGSVIHAVKHSLHNKEHIDPQDIQNLGGLRKRMPVTFIVFVVCGAALSGIPFFSGFQSKDAILSACVNWATHENWRWLVVGVAFIVSFLTVLYTFKLIWYIFLSDNSDGKVDKSLVFEAPLVMKAPMIFLAIFSLWWIVSPNPMSFSGWFALLPDSHTIEFISLGWILLALVTAYYLFRKKKVGYQSSNLFSRSFYLDPLYHYIIGKPTNRISFALAFVDKHLIDSSIHFIVYFQITISHVVAWCDRVFVDGAVNFITGILRNMGAFIRSFHRGKIQNYIFWAATGLVILYYLASKVL